MHTISVMRASGTEGPSFSVCEVGLTEVRRLLNANTVLRSQITEYFRIVDHLVAPYREEFFRCEDEKADG